MNCSVLYCWKASATPPCSAVSLLIKTRTSAQNQKNDPFVRIKSWGTSEQRVRARAQRRRHAPLKTSMNSPGGLFTKYVDAIFNFSAIPTSSPIVAAAAFQQASHERSSVWSPSPRRAPD